MMRCGAVLLLVMVMSTWLPCDAFRCCSRVAVGFRPATTRYRPAHGGTRGLLLQSGRGPNKGFNVLELTGAVIPQGALVKGVKTTWRLAWTTLMRELAPQSKDGDYVRPSYGFTGEIGTSQFPDEPGRFHLYAGKGLTVSLSFTFTFSLSLSSSDSNIPVCSMPVVPSGRACTIGARASEVHLHDNSARPARR